MSRAPKTLLAASAMVATGLLGLVHYRAHPETAERIELHGTWRIIARDTNGQAVPIAPNDGISIDGVAMTVTFVERGVPSAPARLGLMSSANVGQMDIRLPLQPGSTPANGWDGVSRAVYERRGSTLRIAWNTNDVANPSPNGRPTPFPESPQPYTMRLVLAR